MIKYPYEKGSAAGFFRNCVAEGSIADPFLFLLFLFRFLLLQSSYKFRVRPGVELIFFRRLFKVFFTCS